MDSSSFSQQMPYCLATLLDLVLALENLTYLSKSGCLTKAPFGKNRVHRLRYLHEPKCCLHPCYLLTNRDAQGTVFHPSRQQLGFQRPKNKNK